MPDLSPHANCRFGRSSLPIPERSCSANGGVGWSFPHVPQAVGQPISIGDREFSSRTHCPPRVHLSGWNCCSRVAPVASIPSKSPFDWLFRMRKVRDRAIRGLLTDACRVYVVFMSLLKKHRPTGGYSELQPLLLPLRKTTNRLVCVPGGI